MGQAIYRVAAYVWQKSDTIKPVIHVRSMQAVSFLLNNSWMHGITAVIKTPVLLYAPKGKVISTIRLSKDIKNEFFLHAFNRMFAGLYRFLNQLFKRKIPSNLQPFFFR